MSLKLSFLKNPKSKSETAVMFVQAGNVLGQSVKDLDKEVKKHISNAVKGQRAFEGKNGQVLGIFLPKNAPFQRVILVGLGEPGKLDSLGVETLGGKLLPVLEHAGAENISVFVDVQGTDMEAHDFAAHFAMGLKLRSYTFDKYKSKPDDEQNKPDIKEIVFVTDAWSKASKTYETYGSVAEGVFLARDLVNEPANTLYPESYAALIRDELKPLGVDVEIIDEKKMHKLGFGAHLAVGMGSARPPRVVIMRWNGSGKKKTKKTEVQPVAFIGKGVTFDTGGISLKPGAGMDEMKMDMGGSASVVGAMKALALRKAKADVIGIVGLAENMPSDRAYRPGDIVTSMNGKTIEVLNTDAEGRLVLIDALTYVQDKYKPRMMIDLATLTGAMMVALGYEYAGAFVNDDDLWSQLEYASKKTGEKLWRMPLNDSYRKEMDSTVADYKNLGAGRWGGACSAAGFLENFVNEGTPWAHLDIAGTAWNKSVKPTVPKGGSGYGVRILDALISDNYE